MRSTASRITKYPLADRIAAVSNAWKSRTNIVSPDLCDDVIQRLAPSLAQHIGCTIIDINPGIGLWSSKLHDYLKPRNHILMEPKQNVYLPFLQPLLDAPGSRYRLKDWLDSDLWQPKRYVEEGLLHDAEGYGGPPPTTEEPNNSIFIIANLAGQRQKVPGESRAATSAHLKAIDFSRAVRHRSGFQTYGPTRMLMWLSDEDKRALLPRTVGYRGKLSVYMEANLDLEEIVGFPHASGAKIRREDALNIGSSKQVAKRMQENDIKIPLHRQTGAGDRKYDLSEVSRYWHKELQDLEQGFQRGYFSQYAKRPAAEPIDGHMPKEGSGKAKSRTSVTLTPEYKRMMTLRHVANGQNVTIDRINTVLKKQEKIDRMDLDLHREDIKALEQEEIINALDYRIQDFKDELEGLTAKQMKTLFFLDDDRRAFAMDPPLLMWDRRKAEPLSAEKDEFYAPKEIALLDFQPKTTDKFPMTSEQSYYFDLISTSLLGPGGQATLKHLKTIAPGAFEALVPQVPAIRDPRKGGRYDIESVRVRAVTPEMFHGLAVAWDNWVFKPPIEDALTQFGTNFKEGTALRKGAIARL
ncbi:hypothetical protein HO133_005100 [Letharia lupina]|uniref:rRNA adenine N(6)-methyltransferase n=1 Tax=Letharia lupina TaxID=560253 RepID=A0A8H6F8N5_9LECA|nr:uncharacterized protein HO133_005100 [Letharia lupina]KAF6219275.1 hypothetical protein HO133_005100 [Letharia lupina]